MDLVQALKNASFNNDNLSKRVLKHLQDPSQKILKIEDPDDIYSLKVFLTTQGVSKQTYMDICEALSEYASETSMLSFD